MASTLLLESLFSSANQQSGIETSALRGIIDRTNLPANIGTGSTGDSTRSFIIKKTPTSDVSITSPAGSDAGAWSGWNEIESSDPITANQAGNCIILANLYANSQGAPAGGGDRLFVSGRIVRVRGGDSTVLEDSRTYGPRNLPAGSGTTSQAFSDASKEISKVIGVLGELETGDVIRIDARIVSQATSGTKTVVFKSDENFLEIGNWSANPTGQGGRTDSEINSLITTFLNALPSGSLSSLKNQLDVKGDSDINSLIHTYLNSLNATDITILKTALDVKTDEELRTLIDNEINSNTIREILNNLPDRSVKADFLKNVAVNFGDSLPQVSDYKNGTLFFERPTSFLYVLKPATGTPTPNRNRVTVTIASNIFILDNNLYQDNYSDLVGRIENKVEGNSRQFELFLREDILDEIGINSTQDNTIKFYVDINGTTLGLHRYANNNERVLYPDILENVRWIPFESVVGSTIALPNGRLNIDFYRDSAKTQPINIKPETNYTSPSWQRLGGDTAPDLSNFLNRGQIEALIRSLEDVVDPIISFSFNGTSGSIDRTPVTESPALTNSFSLGDTSVIIKKIVQFTGDNTIEITVAPSLYSYVDTEQIPKEDLINAFKEIKIKINDLTLSFGDAIGGINSAGYSWDVDSNESYFQFDGKQPGTVKVGTNDIEVFQPITRKNYLPNASSQDNGKVVAWDQTTGLPYWKTEASLDSSVTDQLEDLDELESALRYRVSLGSSTINITTTNIGHNTSKRVPAFRSGKADRFILAVAGQEYEFSAKALHNLPRSPIGSLTSINGLEFGDTTKFYIGRSTGTVEDFLFSSDTAGSYTFIIYSYNIDIEEDARKSSGTFKEHVEDYVADILNTPESDVDVSQDDNADKIALVIKPKVIEPANLRSGDTTVPPNRAIITDGTGSGVRFVTPNRLIHNAYLNSMSITDTSTQNFPESAFSPSFNVTSETGYFVIDLTIGWSRGATAARLNALGDSSLILNATVFTHSLVSSTARTQTNLGGVPAIQKEIYLGSTLLGEYTFYLSKGSDNILGHWERFRYVSGQSGGNKNWEFSRRLTMAFNAFIS